MKKIKWFFAKGGATHLIWAAFSMPELLKTRGFARLMNRIFSGLAPGYDRVWEKMGDPSVTLGPLTSAARNLSETPGRILDLACGTGLATFVVRDLFPESQVVGADLSMRMIEVMKEKSGRSGVQDLHGLVCNSAQLPFGNGRFDLVITQNAPPYLEEMVRVLRPGGRLFLIYSFVFLDLVRGVAGRRLKRMGLEQVMFLPAEEGAVFSARKPMGK
jgi:ubiquinone/menaquinone biosynthesis C-methylase UbiE